MLCTRALRATLLTLAGTIAWTSGDRAGLKLAEPIPATDVLLRSLSE